MVTETDEVIDAMELPESERVDLAKRMAKSISDEAGIRHDAILDRLDANEEVTFITEWFGDDLAEAKGRAFKTRDIIENHTGREVSVSHTGTAWQFPDTTYYEFRLTVEPADK